MGFLDNLGSSLLSSINSMFGIAENTPHGLDSSLPFGTGAVNFGALGAFANQIDQSAERSYLQEGMIRNIRPRGSEVLMQTPDLTVVIKKRQFSSLSENYRTDLMNADEKLFMRASKRLFYNKIRAIAAYEQLTKLEQIGGANGGVVADNALPQVFHALDSLSSLGVNLVDAKTQSSLELIRKVKQYSDPNFTTTWMIDNEKIPYSSDLGEGTGVFELTLVSSMECSSSVNLGGGSASLTIEDPYKLMLINNDDIDKAIQEAAGLAATNNIFSFTERNLQDTTQTLKQTLNEIRADRGASKIIFLVNDNSLQFHKVRAIIDDEGREINFTFDGGLVGLGSSVSVDISAFDGINGLAQTASRSNPNGSEEDIFKQIISNLFQLIGINAATQNNTITFNKQTNYVRKKMRLQYNGHSIIQPMDSIHIFVSAKSFTDERLTQGLTSVFSTNSVLNQLNNSLNNIQNAYNDLKNAFGTKSDDSFIETEKEAIVGSEFPTWLWLLMRNDITRQGAGTQVFSGVVESAPHSYDNGKYTLRVTAKDNTCYFKFGQINVNPSVSVFNSALYDPLTPFKVDFDASSGLVRGEVPPLLDENIALLTSGAVKAKNGRFRGATLSQELWQIQDAEPTPTIYRKKLHDPDGFVYRWKEGIGSLVWNGEPHATMLGSFASEASININKDPFAGQDVMNVLSLLVTGNPYNFNTFMKAAIQSNQLSRDTFSNQDASTSFYRGLISDLTKQNTTWGNFVPFKKLIVNESGYQFLRRGEFDIITQNARITDLLTERAKRFDQLVSILPTFANNPQFYKVGGNSQIVVDTATKSQIDIASLQKLSDDLISLDFQIAAEKKSFSDSISSNPNLRSNDGTLRIFGDDISFDSSLTQSSSPTTEAQRLDTRRRLRKELNYLTQRRLWKVKANDDVNLFIVDDSYDKNYDIQAFERSLAGKPELFKSTYTNVFERIEAVKETLGLEVYADSQGHIQVRPPQYNKMPSSVFYKMITEKDRKGIQIFPDYLESLFFNQIQGLTDQLSITEDQIRVRAAALGYTTDSDAVKILGGSISALGTYSFIFISNPDDGEIGSQDLRNLLIQANPDFLLDVSIPSALNELTSTIQSSLNSSVNFDIGQRIAIVNQNPFGGADEDINVVIDKIGRRLEDKTGEPAPTRGTLLSNDRSLAGGGRSQLDALNLTTQISQLIADRQNIIKLLANALKNLNQGLVLNSDKNPTTNFLTPFLNNTKTDAFPEIIEHMIEDEDYDDFGYQSGKRYVITDDKIINFTLTEKPPDWTVVQVNGQLSSDSPPPQIGGHLGDGGGGNLIATSYSVDYDMWRMYGFRQQHAANVPFFSNATTQCAPYGVFLLNRARKEIFQGSLTMAGNEAIQCGEVYYIEDYDLLFYAETVFHNFTFGGTYTTNLALKYGHNPGEYIPTMLDIIGKGLYTNRHQAALVRHVRHGNASGDTHLNVLTLDLPPGQAVAVPLDDLVSGAQGDTNRKALGNVLLATTGLLTPTSSGQKMFIDIRTYSHSDLGVSANSDLTKVANAVQQFIVTPSQSKVASSSFNPDNPPAIIPDNTIKTPIPKESVQVRNIDLAKTDTVDSPSSAAWSIARSLSLSGAPVLLPDSSDPTAIDTQKLAKQSMTVLANKVIDIWVVFSDPDPATVSTTDAQKKPTSQVDLQAQQQAIDAFNKRLVQK